MMVKLSLSQKSSFVNQLNLGARGRTYGEINYRKATAKLSKCASEHFLAKQSDIW